MSNAKKREMNRLSESVTVGEAAYLCEVSRFRIYQLMNAGKLRKVARVGSMGVSLISIARLIEGRETASKRKKPATATERRADALAKSLRW
jgi:hypothetical protein